MRQERTNSELQRFASRSSGRRIDCLSADVHRLLHGGACCAFVISKVNVVNAVDGICVEEFLLNYVDLLLVQPERGV